MSLRKIAPWSFSARYWGEYTRDGAVGQKRGSQ